MALRQRMETIFQREPIDSGWSKVMQDKLQSQVTATGARAKSVECRFSLCRVVLPSQQSQPQGAGGASGLAMDVRLRRVVGGQMMVLDDVTREMESFLYFTREGFDWPDDQGNPRSNAG